MVAYRAHREDTVRAIIWEIPHVPERVLPEHRYANFDDVFWAEHLSTEYTQHAKHLTYWISIFMTHGKKIVQEGDRQMIVGPVQREHMEMQRGSLPENALVDVLI